jgi:hypothetical protein
MIRASVVCVQCASMPIANYFMSQVLYPYSTIVCIYRTRISYMKMLYSHVGCCIWSGIKLERLLVWNYSFLHGGENIPYLCIL